MATAIAVLMLFVLAFLPAYRANPHKKVRFFQWWSPILALLFLPLAYGLHAAEIGKDYINMINGIIYVLNKSYFNWRILFIKPGVYYDTAFALVMVFFFGILKNLVVRFLFKAMKYKYNEFEKFSDKVQGHIRDMHSVFAYEVNNGLVQLKLDWIFPHLFFKWSLLVGLMYVLLNIYGVVAGNQMVPAYAALPMLFLLEAFWYLEGEQPKSLVKPEDNITTEEPETATKRQFDKLWEEYLEIWPENYLLAWRRTNERVEQEELQRLDAMEYVELRSIDKDGYHISINDYQIYKDIVEGNDELIRNIHYNKIAPYLVTSWLKKILRGEKILIVTPLINFGDDDYHESLKNWLESWMEKMSGNKLFWKVQCFDRMGNQQFRGDVLISSAEELIARNVTKTDWFREVSTVVFFDAARLFAESISSNHILLNILRLQKEDLRIIVLSESRAYLQASIKKNLNIRKAFYEREIMVTQPLQQYVICWRLEGSGYFYHQVIHGEQEDYLGVEPVLAILPWRDQISPIHILNQHRQPYIEHLEELDSLRQNLRSNVVKGKKLLGIVKEQIKFQPNDFEYYRDDDNFFLIHDRKFNLSAALLKWSNFADHAAFLQIVSPPYLLRDYLIDNLDYFQKTPFLSFASSMMDCKFNVGLTLLEMMVANPLTARQIHEELNKVYDKVPNPREGLKDLFRTAFGIDIIAPNFLIIHQEYVFDEFKNEFLPQVMYELSPNIKANYQLRFLDTIDIIDDFDDNVLQRISYDLLYQKYLPGQQHAFNGRSYQILDLDVENKFLRTTNSPVEKIISYRQDREVALHQLLPSNPKYRLNPQEGIHLHLSEGTFDVHTHGFYTFRSGLNLKQKNVDYTYSSMDARCPIRHYLLGRMMQVDMECPESLIRHKAQIASTLVALMNEVFLSLFPETYHYLMAVSSDSLFDDPNFQQLYPSFTDNREAHGEDRSKLISLIVFEDAHQDLGMVHTVYARWKEIFKWLDDYLMWVMEGNGLKKGQKGSAVSEGISKEDYYKAPLARDQFLKFGLEQYPSFVNIEATQAFLRDILGVNYLTQQRIDFHTNPDSIDLVQAMDQFQCDFCGTSIPEPQVEHFMDGRKRCENCRAVGIDTEMEVRAVYNEAKRYFRRKGISFKRSIDIEIVNAGRIQKELGQHFEPGKGYIARTIGLAIQQGGAHRILVENGFPKTETLCTIVHELTHIWQYSNLDMKKLEAQHDKLLIEGHATWAEVDCVNLLNLDGAYANKQVAREDVYGKGYQLLTTMMERNGFSNAFNFLERHYA